MSSVRTVERRRAARGQRTTLTPGTVLYRGEDPLVRLVVEKIAEAIRPTQIHVYGSRVTGGATLESDVDVLILLDGETSHRDIQLQVHRLFSSPAVALDVSVMGTGEFEEQRGIANTLAREVHENGVLCYG
ncbi:MAG: nucleotidyltransferase domain-containing protein [Lentisphaerae bacterium]|jgi:predicted nucleotidyltransferase|nr:nucleotidyltransferase domain-containing protein [Lentisphaerota bacterium]